VVLASILLASMYPSFVPPQVEPIYHVTLGDTKVSTNYSLDEYAAAAYINAQLGDQKILIVSDPGLARVLGGLTGKDSFYSEPDTMRRLNEVFRQAITRPFDGELTRRLHGELSRYFGLGGYGSIVIAVSPRTHYWVVDPGLIDYYVPMSSDFVIARLRENLLRSPALTHLFTKGDVDLFLLPIRY